MSTVAVLGAGIAGLTAAHQLASTGHDVTVIDASSQVGGFLAPLRMTGPHGDLLLDAGAESFATRAPAVGELVESLGLAVTAPQDRAGWCVPANLRAFPLPAAGVLGIPVDPFAPDAMRALGLVGAARAWVDRLLPARVGDLSNLDAFVRSRMGSAVADRLVAAIVGGVHSTSPNLLDVSAIHPSFRTFFAEEGTLTGVVRRIRAAAPAGRAVHGIVGGLHTLPTTLQQRISAAGGAVLLGEAVESVTQRDGRWVVRGASGVELSDTERLIVALPARPALALLGSAGILDAGDRATTVTRGTDIALVTLVVRSDELARFPRGTGVLVSPAAGCEAKASTHANAKWQWVADEVERVFGPGHHVLRLSFGRHGDVLPDDDSVFVDAATRELGGLYGVRDARVVASAVVRWPDALAPVTPTMREVVGDAVAAAAAAGVGLTGSWVAGTGLAATIPHAVQTATTMGISDTLNEN